MAVGAANVGAAGTHVRDCHANSTGRFGDGSALLPWSLVVLEGRKDAFTRIGITSPNLRALTMDSKFQGVVDTFDAVILQLQQKARGHLWLRSPSIEEGRRRMGEELPRHQVLPCCRSCATHAVGQGMTHSRPSRHRCCYLARLRLQCPFEVPHVDAAGRAHDHVLRPFHDLAMHT